jgi:hypothetical protein
VGVYAFHLGPTISRSPKDPHGFLVGDANERAIRAFSLALTAPSLATAETIKVPMIAEQLKMPGPRLSSLGERAFRKG